MDDLMPSFFLVTQLRRGVRPEVFPSLELLAFGLILKRPLIVLEVAPITWLALNP